MCCQFQQYVIALTLQCFNVFFKKTPVRVGTSMITVMLSHTNILADETPVEVEGVGICSEIQDYTKFYVNAISNAELKTPLISGLIQHFIISKWFHHVVG